MSELGQDKVAAFDMLFTNNHIQMLKILMPYFDPAMQKNMAIYIKYLELQHTLSFFRKYPDASLPALPREPAFNLPKLCGEVLPYCSSAEKSKLEGMRNMFQTFENYKEMMETVQMMKELFPEGENPMSGFMDGGIDPDFLSGLSGLSGMSGMSGFDPAQMSQMFEMFQAMSGAQDSGGGEDGGQTETSGMDGG